MYIKSTSYIMIITQEYYQDHTYYIKSTSYIMIITQQQYHMYDTYSSTAFNHNHNNNNRNNEGIGVEKAANAFNQKNKTTMRGSGLRKHQQQQHQQ